MHAIFLVRVPKLSGHIAIPGRPSPKWQCSPAAQYSSVMKDGTFRGILQIAKVLVFGGVGSLPDGRPSDTPQMYR